MFRRLNRLILRVTVRRLHESPRQTPPSENKETEIRWRQRGEAAANFCWVAGGATCAVLIAEGMPGYGIVMGFLGGALAELCTLKFE